MTRCSYLRTLSLALCFALASPVGFAAPEDDYKQGAKSLAQGDLVTAMSLLRKAADAGHAAAQAAYAQILDRSDSDEDAVAYFRKSADQGNADGQFGLGAMLASGQGVKRDVAAARKWITLAAEQGHKLAINELALAHLTGGLGFAAEVRNDQESLRWIRRAGESDFLPAVEGLADAYRNGKFGLDPDPRKADEWAAKARKLRGLKEKRKGDRK